MRTGADAWRRLSLPRAHLFARRSAVVCSEEGFAPDEVWPTGVLAHAQIVRGLLLPAGTTIWIDAEHDEVQARLPEVTVICGHPLPEATEIHLPSGALWFGPGAPWFVFPAAIVHGILRSIASAVRGDVEVVEVTLGSEVEIGGVAVAAGGRVTLHRDGRVELWPKPGKTTLSR